MGKRALKIIEVIGWFLLVWLVFIGLVSSIKQIPPRPDSYNPGFVLHPFQTILHALPGVLFMIIGPLQFITSLRTRMPGVHRWLGRVFMISCLLIAFSGFSIAITFPYSGMIEMVAVFFFGPLFLYSLYKAYYHIKRREVLQHREWIIRVFSIGMGISLIRIFIALFMIFTSYEQIEIFAFTFWAGFGGALLVGEAWIRLTRK